MNFKKLIFLAAFFLTCKAYGQNSQIPSGLKDLVEQSFQKYPKIESMNQVVEMSRVQVDLAKDGYMPVSSASLSYRRLYPTPSITLPIATPPVNIQFTPSDNYNTGIDLIQPIIDFGTGAKVGKAKSNLKTATDNLESFKVQLAYQIAQIYYSILFIDQGIRVQEQQINLLKASLQQIKVKIQNGYALKYDLLSSQVQLTNTENYYADLQNQRNKQYNTLNMLTGRSDIDYISDTNVNQEIFNVVTDSVIAIAVSNNPDLRIANDKIETAKWDIEAANRLRLPSLNLMAGTGFKNGYQPNIETQKFNYYVGGIISIPIIPATRPSKQRQLAEISMNTSKLDMNTQTLTLTNNVLNALRDVHNNEKKCATSGDLVNQAHLAFELATQRYQDGVNTNLDLLTAQANYQNALLGKLQFEYNLLLSKMTVSQLIGNKWWQDK